MKDGDHGRRAVSPFKAEGDKQEHPDERRERHSDGLVAQLLAGDLADGVCALNICVALSESAERLPDFGARRIDARLLCLRRVDLCL